MIYAAVGLLSLLNVYLIYRVSHLYSLAEDWRRQAVDLECEAASWKKRYWELAQEPVESV
tara:strand:- start:173 stop:352 length:180 start_codon:yes stop_codon:yes gene_type:complete